MNFLIGMGFGLAAGLIALIILKVATLRLRKELKVAAGIELEEIRDQEGYNSISFLGRDRHSELREDEIFERELKGTISGERLTFIDRSIWKISAIVFVVTTVTIIAIRYMKEV